LEPSNFDAPDISSWQAPNGYAESHDECRLDAAFDDRGEAALKIIARPLRVFALAGAKKPTTKIIEPAPPLALPDKPSIAVLPLQNMSGDPEQEYFADGIVEDIITALSRVKWFFVIARNSSFTYKGRAVDVRQVGRELGVRYVLEGSIRKSGNRVRITGQLIEAATGTHVWADRFEGRLEDVFDLQDRITETVVAAIEPSLQIAEIRRSSFKPTDSLDAYDLYLRALPHYYAQTRESLGEALRLLDKAIAIDPDYASAKAFAAAICATRHTQRWTTLDDISKGGRLAHEALVSSRDEPTTIAFAAHALAMLTRDYDTALAAMDRAIFLNPNSAQIVNRSAFVRYWVSDADRAIDEFTRSIRLSPVDPEIGFVLGGLAYAFLMKGEFEKALEYARRSAREMPRWVGAWCAVAVASVKTDRLQEAQEAAQRILLLSPNFSASEERRRYTVRDASYREWFSDTLLKAGLPE
jgi:adenylate cyclase